MPRIQRGGIAKQKVVCNQVQTETLTTTGDASFQGDVTVTGDFTVSGSLPGPTISGVAREAMAVDVPGALFATDSILTAEATNAVEIAETTTQAHGYRIFGNGVSATTINLNLATDAGDPGSDLLIRIETDSSDEPSGTLADANATASVTHASLTASLVNTTATFAGAFTLTNNTKYWLVLQRAAFANDGTNFYQVGTNTSSDETMHQGKFYNGSVWAASGVFTNLYVSFAGMHTFGIFAPADLTDVNYVGFPTTALAAGDTGNFKKDGVVTTSGLTTGNRYNWSSSALTRVIDGTNIGYAKSATEFQLSDSIRT